MSNKNEKTFDEAKVQQEVVGEMPSVFQVDEQNDALNQVLENSDEVPAEEVEEAAAEVEKKESAEVEDDTVQTERKVIALVILGNLHAVIGILKEYKWRDKDSKAIWETCVKLNNERKHISTSTVQIALNAENLGDTDIESILSEIPSPNLLIPFANKLIQSQGE